jgi:hypothetical protein
VGSRHLERLIVGAVLRDIDAREAQLLELRGQVDLGDAVST